MRSSRSTLMVVALLASVAACSGEAASTAAPTPATDPPPTTGPPVPTAMPSTGLPEPTEASTAGPPIATEEVTTAQPSPPVAGSRVAGTGFSLELPDGWSAFRLIPEGEVEPLAGAAPLPTELENLAVAAALQGATVLAVGAGDGNAPADTALFTPLGGDDEPAGAGVSDQLVQFLTAQGVSDLSAEMTEVGGRPAARATFRQVDGAGQEQEATTVYAPDAVTSLVIAFSRPLPSASPPMIDEILATVRFS